MIDLYSINERHRRLSDVFLKGKHHVPGFRADLEELLQDIKRQSREVPSIEDYQKLLGFLREWKEASSALGIDLSHIFLVPPTRDWTLAAPDQPAWTENSLKTWVETKAHELNKNRALEWYNEMPVDEIMWRFQQSLSSEEAERQSKFDWAQAELYLATKVLSGDFDLILSFGAASYWRLEGREGRMWLRHAKTLKAYLNWKGRKGGWGAEDAQRDYLDACDELRNWLLDAKRKAPQTAFEQVAEFLESELLDKDGKLDENKDKTRRWLESKAARLIEVGEAEHVEESRRAAKDQMIKFYENITRAAMGTDAASTQRVLQALGFLPRYIRHEAISNCFEMALAIYFLDAEVARKILDQSHQLDVAEEVVAAIAR